MRGHGPAYSAILLLILIFQSSLYASGLLMGKMTSVNQYGAQDVTRNPALLGLQSMHNAIGVTASYRRELSTRVYLREISASLSNFKIKDSDFIEACIDYSRKFGPVVVGINLSNVFDSQTILLSGTFLTPAVAVGKRTSRDSNRNHSGAIAVAIRLGPSHTIGVRSDVIYKHTRNTESGRSLMAQPMTIFNDITTIEENSIIINPEIGYHFKTGAIEAGIIVTPGKPSWDEETQEMERIRIGTPSDIEFKGRGTLPFTAQYRTGPGITAGAYTKQFSSVGVGLESGLVFPIAFDNRHLVPFYRFFFVNSGTFRIKSRTSKDPAVFLRGGIELQVSSRALLSLGGGLLSTAYRVRVKDLNPLSPQFMGLSTTRRTTLTLYGTWGLDFFIGARHTMTLGLGVSHVNLDERKSFKHPVQTFYANIMTSRIKIKTLNLDLITAVSIAF